MENWDNDKGGTVNKRTLIRVAIIGSTLSIAAGVFLADSVPMAIGGMAVMMIAAVLDN